MTSRSWVRRLFARRPRTARKAPARCRPTLEALEDRALLDTGLVGGGLPHDNLQPSVALNYIIATQGVFPQPEGNSSGAGGDVLMGEVRLFAGDFAPGGWEFAEGQLLPINQNAALFSLLGTTYGGDGERRFALPDLRGRVPVQTGEGPGLTERELGEQFGVETVTLTGAQLPAHIHTIPGGTTPWLPGGGQPVENVQPSLGVNFIVALQGIPDYLGEVRLFAGNFAPDGWAFADGQLLSTTRNRALFERLGTTYGGDGFSTFALPDLRGRTPVQAVQGPWLTDLELGEQFGVETVRLLESELPAHSHTIPGGTTGASGGGQPLYNVQPSLGMNFIISMYGIFPSPDRTTFSSLPTIGEVRLFASDSLPSGWALADGSLIPISENETLFAILGTTYGGDGQETFALPDLRGRAVVHAGQGPGLTARTLGERFGAEIVTLTTDQIPAHFHIFLQPTVASNQAAVTVNEGSAASNSGTFDDPQGTGTVTLTASLGTVTKNDDGTWSWSHGPADGPDGPTVVTITATNTVGLTATTTFTLTVNNVAPTITISGDGRVNQGVPYELSLGALTDPGSDAVTQYTVDWGDGSSDTYTAAGTQTHVYTSAGTYLITVDLVDEDGTHTDRAGPLSVAVNAAPTDLTLGHSSVEENQPPDTLVGTLSTTDPNSGDTFTYTLVSGEGDYALFRIDGNQLMTTARFDFEARSSYSIRVRSTDADGLSTEKVFTLGVTDVNEAPTDVALSNASIPENAGADAVVGSLSGTDPDAGDGLTFSLPAGLADNGAFTLSGTTLRANASFDFETKSSYAVTVRATDAGGLTFDQTFTVSVTDVNDAPVLGGAVAGQAMDDNRTVNPFAGFTITDVDADAGQELTVVVTQNHWYNGTFTAQSLATAGFVALGDFRFSFTGTAGDAEAAIGKLVFRPRQNHVAVEEKCRSSFTVTADDGLATARSTGVWLTITSVNDAPQLGGAVADQAINDNQTVRPFAAFTISDADRPVQALTVDVQLSHVGNGRFTAASLSASGFMSVGNGRYRFAGTAAQAQAAIRKLVYAPTENQVAPGQKVKNYLRVYVTDNEGATSSNLTTSVVATSI